jgi:5'-deoxynucleotidase YfbR-like HD superfamily hydrolase
MARGPATKDAAPRAWQRMLSGRRLDLLDPSPLDVEIEDIAHGLARVARWNGQTRGAHIYSVAQHSLLVESIARQVEPGLGADAALVVLLHDAPEYVVGDIISPFKAVVGDAYKAVENRLLAAIHLRFGLPAVPGQAVTTLAKTADRAAAFLEATRLAGFATEEALRFFGRPAAVPPEAEALLEPCPAEEAKALFLARFQALEGARA